MNQEEFEAGLEPYSCVAPTMFSWYWDYLKIFDDLTIYEKKIKIWLEIEGYWGYLHSENCRITFNTPCKSHKNNLKLKAMRIMQDRFKQPLRLYTAEEIMK